MNRRWESLLNEYLDTKKIYRFFLTDEHCMRNGMPVFLFITSTSISLFYLFLLLTFGEPLQEGTLEDVTSLFYPVATLLYLITFFSWRKERFSTGDRRKIYFWLVAMMALAVFLFGEELSWGERVLGFEPSEFFIRYNYQHESNLHNFFNPLFIYAYPIVGIGFFLFHLFVWFFGVKGNNSFFFLVMPPGSLFGLVFAMALMTSHGHSEIFEELTAVLCLLYALRLYYCLRFPNNSANIRQD